MQKITEMKKRICEAIPVYPEEISSKALSKAVGISPSDICRRIRNMTDSSLICEGDDSSYCFASTEDKEQQLMLLIGGR